MFFFSEREELGRLVLHGEIRRRGEEFLRKADKKEDEAESCHNGVISK